MQCITLRQPPVPACVKKVHPALCFPGTGFLSTGRLAVPYRKVGYAYANL